MKHDINELVDRHHAIKEIVAGIVYDRATYLNPSEASKFKLGIITVMNKQLHGLLTNRSMADITKTDDFIIGQHATMWMKFQLILGVEMAESIFTDVFDVVNALTRTIDDDNPELKTHINYVLLKNSDEARTAYKFRDIGVKYVEDWAKWIFVLNAYLTTEDMFNRDGDE